MSSADFVELYSQWRCEWLYFCRGSIK